MCHICRYLAAACQHDSPILIIEIAQLCLDDKLSETQEKQNLIDDVCSRNFTQNAIDDLFIRIMDPTFVRT